MMRQAAASADTSHAHRNSQLRTHPWASDQLCAPYGNSAGWRAASGIASPSENFLGDGIDLKLPSFINPVAKYLKRAEGWSIPRSGTYEADILIFRRSVTALKGEVVVATWEGKELRPIDIRWRDSGRARSMALKDYWRKRQRKPRNTRRAV